MVMGELELKTELLVIGSGPGGYSAAFRAADLGLEVTMVDPSLSPGGVCLFQGCIPSKTYLHLSELLHDARRASDKGLSFGEPDIDLSRLRAWRDEVVNSMADGLVALCKRRGIELIGGKARFENSTTVSLDSSSVRRVCYDKVIIATGSSPIALPGISAPSGGRIMDSSHALALEEIPGTLMVVGGGYIGLELGLLYSRLGSKVKLVEFAEHLLQGVDRDLFDPLERQLTQSFDSIRTSTRVAELNETDSGVEVRLETTNGPAVEHVDRVLVAIGRTPNSGDLGLEQTRVEVGSHGEIVVDDQQRTADSRIFAVGDVTGQVMLAHTASRQGKVAAEVIAGQPSAYDVRAVPAIVYTDPQIGWCGLTEEQAIKQNIPVTIRRFPWKYSGRATTMGAADGLTKIVAEPESGRVLGFGITGRNAEELIAEGVLAIEMGALAEDLALCMHPHPSLSEITGETAELFLGHATHMLSQKT